MNITNICHHDEAFFCSKLPKYTSEGEDVTRNARLTRKPTNMILASSAVDREMTYFYYQSIYENDFVIEMNTETQWGRINHIFSTVSAFKNSTIDEFEKNKVRVYTGSCGEKPLINPVICS